MAVVFKPFETDYGYKSPGFSVDNQGNVIVRTITNTYTPPVIPPAPDYNVNETAGNFSFLKEGQAVTGSNPTITVERGSTYNFVLNLNSLAYNIYLPDNTDPNALGILYNEGLSHQNQVTGLNLTSGQITVSQTWQQEPNGYNRTAQVIVPDTTGTAVEGKKLPVVICLHDEGFTQATGIANVNWIANTILIAPQGYGNVWNVGYQTSKADDISFIDSIIDTFANYDNIDTREITIIGYGNGAQLAMQYSNYTQNASVKNIIAYNGLIHEDQYNSLDNTFYNYTLEDQNQDASTVINWTQVIPLGNKKIVMFNGRDDLRFLYNGGVVNNQNFYSAEDSIYALVKANNSIESKLTSSVQQPDGSDLFSYNNDNVQLFAFTGVANNFTQYQNSIRAKISSTIAVQNYLDIPVSTTLSGAQAQGQQSGTLTFTVPVDAPDNLFYGDTDGLPYGSITVNQPSIIGVGVFSSILDTGDLLASGVNADITLSPTGTGLVTIAPERTGIINNVDINVNTLTTNSTVQLTPNANVTISPQSNGVLTIRPLALGTVDNVDVGSVIPGSGTFSNLISAQGTLNSTTLGLTTAAQAAFTTATVQNDPANANDVTRKQYVDNTATVLAVALGV